jgi:hypothetical protein
MMVALAALDIALGSSLSLFPIYFAWAYFMTGVMLGAAAVLTLGILRLKNHSVAGVIWFMVAIGLFQFWNVAVMWVSLLTRWWAATQPGYRIGTSAAIGLIPLLIAIWKLSQRLAQQQ